MDTFRFMSRIEEMMKLELLGVALALCACVLTLNASGPARADDAPQNFVMIMVDTLRPDRLGAYHYDTAETPALDALASESILFENAYAHASMTLPSMASLMTGRLPAGHRIFENNGTIPPRMPTIATMFKKKGFQTAGFIGNWALRPSRKFNRDFDTYTSDYTNTEGVRDHPENRAEPLTDEAIQWLQKRKPEEPFFLWVHYQEPHGPYEPPSFKAPDKGAKGPVLPEGQDNSGRNAIPKYQWLGHGKLNEYQARYDGEIKETDRHVGRLIDALRKLKLLDKSVVLFSSDHGESFGEDEIYCAHGTGLGEALLHVPLMMRIPGHAPERRKDRVRLIDVAPTAAELFDLKTPKLRGRSLLKDEGDRPVIAQVGVRAGTRWRSVRIGEREIRQEWKHKPVQIGFGVATDEAGSQAEARTKKAAMKILQEYAPWPPMRKAPKIKQEDRKALEALGYIDAEDGEK
jgi:arylsulfatase A-like enzyme